MGPHCDHMHPHKREAEAEWTDTKTEQRKMQPQAKECRRHRKLEKQGACSAREPQRDHGPAAPRLQTGEADFRPQASGTGKEEMAVVLSQQVCGSSHRKLIQLHSRCTSDL